MKSALADEDSGGWAALRKTFLAMSWWGMMKGATEMAKAAKTTKAGSTESVKLPESKRTDGRKALLVYMQTDLIQAAKDAASDNEENVFQFVERNRGQGARMEEAAGL